MGFLSHLLSLLVSAPSCNQFGRHGEYKKYWQLNLQQKSPIWWPLFGSHKLRSAKFLYQLVFMVFPKLNWDKHLQDILFMLCMQDSFPLFTLVVLVWSLEVSSKLKAMRVNSRAILKSRGQKFVSQMSRCITWKRISRKKKHSYIARDLVQNKVGKMHPFLQTSPRLWELRKNRLFAWLDHVINFR